MIIQFRCPCVTDRLDFILLTQFIKIVNTNDDKIDTCNNKKWKLMLIANDHLNGKALLAPCDCIRVF